MEQQHKSDRRSAQFVGVFFLLAIASYGIGNGLIESLLQSENFLSTLPEHKTQLIVGALLMLMNSALVLGIGLIMFPILKRYSSTFAHVYLVARIVESTLLTVGIICLFMLLPIAKEFNSTSSENATIFQSLSTLAMKGNYFAYQIAMMVLGIGSLFFCYALCQPGLLPRPVTMWGSIGYAIFSIGAVLEIFGYEVGLIMSIPGGLFELVLGLWLILKGFNTDACDKSSQTIAGIVHQ